MASENNFVQIYDQKKRKRLIKKEKARLLLFFGEKEDLASGLIDLAATQKIVLDETAELIKRDGVVEEYKNGENQYGRKKAPQWRSTRSTPRSMSRPSQHSQI